MRFTADVVGSEAQGHARTPPRTLSAPFAETTGYAEEGLNGL